MHDLDIHTSLLGLGPYPFTKSRKTEFFSFFSYLFRYTPTLFCKLFIIRILRELIFVSSYKFLEVLLDLQP